MAKLKKSVQQAKTAAQKRADTIKKNRRAAEKKRKEALAKGRRRSNIATIAALGTIATTTPIMLSKGKKKPQQLTRKEVKESKPGELTGFGKAFRTARNKGMGTEFTYNNKKYVAVTKDDLARKNMTLAQYVRSKRDGLRQK